MAKQKTNEELLAELSQSWTELKQEVEKVANNGTNILLRKGQPLLKKTISVLDNINKKMQSEVADGKAKANRKK